MNEEEKNFKAQSEILSTNLFNSPENQLFEHSPGGNQIQSMRT